MKIILWVLEAVHKAAESNMRMLSEILEKLYIVKTLHAPKISLCSLSLTLAVR